MNNINKEIIEGEVIIKNTNENVIDKCETCKRLHCMLMAGGAAVGFVFMSKLTGWLIIKTCCNPKGLSTAVKYKGDYVCEQILTGAVALGTCYGCMVDKK